jgi:hypothetical protein
MRPLALTLLLVLAGCKSWQVIRSAEQNPIRGQAHVVLQPLDWAGVRVDGVSDKEWLSQDNAETDMQWAKDQAIAARRFTEGARAKFPQLASPEDAKDATISIRPSVVEVATGGLRATELTLRIQVVDDHGIAIEEIRTSAAAPSMSAFADRLGEAAYIAGDNVGEYLSER